MNFHRRNLLKIAPLAGVLGGAGIVTASAQSNSTESTWDRIKRTGVLRAGAAPSEPWYLKDASQSDAPGGVQSGSGMWRGVGIGISKDLADGLGVELEIVETTWGNAVAGLQANQYDMMMLDATPERANAVDFISAPMGYYSYVLLVKDGIEGTTWADFNRPDLTIAVPLGAGTDQFITRFCPDANITRYQDYSQCIAAFQSGRADAFIGAGPSVGLTRAKLNMGTIITAKPHAALPIGTGLRWEPNNRFKDFLSASMTFLYSSGAAQKHLLQYLAFRQLDPSIFPSLVKEEW